MVAVLALSDRWSCPAPRGAQGDRRLSVFDPNALIQAVARSGDREAFARLFDHFAPRVKGLLIKMGASPELAEEIAQETMLVVWRKAGLFDPAKASASTWIVTIARNRRVDLARRDMRSRLSQVYEILDEVDPERPDLIVSGAERDARVRAAMSDLSEDQHRVLELAYVEGLTQQEVAQRLRIPLGTVKSRIRLAMQHLRSKLEDVR